MPDIKQREEKIAENAQKVSFRDYILHMASWKPFVFYKRPDITLYSNIDRVGPLTPTDEYEKQRIEFTKYGLDYDFDFDFFHNYQKLFKTVPCMNLRQFLPFENSDYTDSSGYGIKNCYLTIGAFSDCENILYSFEIKEKCSDVYNSVMVRNTCSNIYQSAGIINSYNIFYSKSISDSYNLRFCTNMIGCNNCIDCDGLQNASYCINNKPLSKEEYNIQKDKILKQKNMFHNKYLQLLNTKLNNIQSTNTNGAANIKCDNIGLGYFNFNVHNGNNLILIGSANGNNDIYNGFVCGSPHMDNACNIFDSGGGDYLYNSDWSAMSSHIYYSFYVENCSYCIGCIGLKNKQFCILNKQYTKEEWFDLADKIFVQMDKDGILGDYFPGYLNPFYFNDTAAYMIDDTFTKEEVTKDGYLRRDGEIKVDIPPNLEVIRIKDLNNYQGFNEKGERKINPEILKKVIKDGKGNFYRIVAMELEFLQKYGLPLPELHWLDRIKLGFKFK